MNPEVQNLLLDTIKKLGKPCTVPEISKALNEKFSDSALYTMLLKMRSAGLVNRAEEDVNYRGSILKRVIWTVA